MWTFTLLLKIMLNNIKLLVFICHKYFMHVIARELKKKKNLTNTFDPDTVL